MKFLAAAAILAPTAIAPLRSALFHFALHTPYWAAWETRWIADIVGMLIVAPLMIAWRYRGAGRSAVRPPTVEVVGIAAGLAAAAGLSVGVSAAAAPRRPTASSPSSASAH
jgi:hypothetical protein